MLHAALTHAFWHIGEAGVRAVGHIQSDFAGTNASSLIKHPMRYALPYGAATQIQSACSSSCEPDQSPPPFFRLRADRLPQTGPKGYFVKQQLKNKLVDHTHYITEHGRDMPEIRDWSWHSVGERMGTTCEKS